MARAKRSIPIRGLKWFMTCDAEDCDYVIGPFDEQDRPPLLTFHQLGWFIAQLYGDLCPRCVKAGKTVGRAPMPVEQLFYPPIEQTYGMSNMEYSSKAVSI